MKKLKGATSGIRIDDGGGCFLCVLILVIKLKEINGFAFQQRSTVSSIGDQ